MSNNTSSIIDFLRKLATDPPQDEGQRKEIAAAAHDLARAVEPLYDQTQRLIYSHTIVPTMDTANDLGLLALLSDPVGTARSTQELAESTGADPQLLSMHPWRSNQAQKMLTLAIVRILRFLAVYKLIDQPGVDLWAGSALTKELSLESNHNGMKHQYQAKFPDPGFKAYFLQRLYLRTSV